MLLLDIVMWSLDLVAWLHNLVVWLLDLVMQLLNLVLWLLALLTWLLALILCPPHLVIWLLELVIGLQGLKNLVAQPHNLASRAGNLVASQCGYQARKLATTPRNWAAKHCMSYIICLC